MPTCKLCGVEADDNAKFCMKCGTPLNNKINFDGYMADIRYCYVCDQPLNGLRVCSCGTEQPYISNPNYTKEQKELTPSGVNYLQRILMYKDHDEFCKIYCALGYGYYGEYTDREIDKFINDLNKYYPSAEYDVAYKRYEYWKKQNQIIQRTNYEKLYKLVEQRETTKNSEKLEEINMEIRKLSDCIYNID